MTDSDERFYGPFLQPGEAPPGGWKDAEDDLTTWHGKLSWRTRHGDAVVCWSAGKPTCVKGASTPEGTLDIMTSSPMDHETWRRPSSSRPKAWVFGTVEITEGGVTFSDIPDPAFESEPEPDVPSLAWDLGADGTFLGRLQDEGFAHAVYETLCNIEYRKGVDPSRWGISWRGAGGMIADLRSLNESYMEFYLSDFVMENGREASESERKALMDEVAGQFSRLGWHAVGEEEARKDHVQALRFLAEAEKLPEGECPAWASPMVERERICPHDRAIMAARTGRLSQDTFNMIFRNLSHEEWRSVAVLKQAIEDAREEGAGGAASGKLS